MPLMILANTLALAALTLVYAFAKVAGPVLCFVWLVGFFCCYVAFRCWRFDRDDISNIKDQ